MSGRLDSNQRPPEPDLGGPVRVFAEKPVDSPPCDILRIVPISAKRPFSTHSAASCCNRLAALQAEIPSGTYPGFADDAGGSLHRTPEPCPAKSRGARAVPRAESPGFCV